MTDWPQLDVFLLEAVVDRIVPSDEDPGAIAAGTMGFVRERLRQAPPGLAEAIRAGLRVADDTARAKHGRGFLEIGADERDGALHALAGEPWFRLLAEMTAEGFYADPGNGGNLSAASWKMLGYDPRLPQRATQPARLALSAASDLEAPFDAIVVGAGAGGGIVACVLAEAGHRVLLIERGRDHAGEDVLIRDHLRNQRLSTYGHNAGPELDGHPRVLADIEGREHILRPHESGYHNNAAAVGSGTLVYGAQAWRFHPEDFRMASRYGVPAGSSMADWPIGYDELEPYYERAEWEIGVAGEAGHPGPRRRGFPMPALPGHAGRRLLTQGAEALGFPVSAVPLLVNSVARHGREACIECGSCVGFRCPSDAKNGTQNTVIPRALATGRCVLLTSATVTKVETDARGKVKGVALIDESGASPIERLIEARAVVLCGGAIETARLLLLSAGARHPLGLGNANDLVGRNLQGHFSAIAHGLFGEETYDPRGPSVSVATWRYNHGSPGVIGGSMIADDFIMLPVIFWKRALPPDLPRWGAAAKAFMRHNYRRVLRLFGPVQEIPTPDARVTLDARVRDRFGLAVARLSGAVHPESVRTARFIRDRAEEWLRASGAVRTWSDEIVPRLSAGQHQAGTCRMGTDPSSSVTDAYGRVWGHDNLFVADASLHPTNGGFNPVLTIMALAFRGAEHIAERLKRA
ncbi:MAG: GMC family oxidoreductase [Hyphomicrobiales bacterium]